ncbi:insulinase family protein [Amycolatopsis sp. NBC_00355]|uniref:insulinase family protein n=1 Tax=Amycolatopsis sp. NBC_00355 TaxID=2975957 RepID=UPI002E2644EF
MTAVLECLPVRIAAGGSTRLPADVYRSGIASGLAHVRWTLATTGASAKVAEAWKRAVAARPEWRGVAASTGAGVGTKVLAGQPALSFTVTEDRLGELLGFLGGTALTWADLDVADAGRTADPRLAARRLAAGEDLFVRPEGPLETHLTILADLDGPAEPATSREPPADLTSPRRAGETHRAGSGRQTWYAVYWDLPPLDPEQAAAAELFLFGVAGAPFAPLYQALRDDLGISYGLRTSVQRRPGQARAWLELSFPTDREAEVREATERVLGHHDVGKWLENARNVLLSSVLAALDFGSGQADALAFGHVVGDPAYSWKVAHHLGGTDLVRLLNGVPGPLTTLGSANIGSYHA